MDRKASPLLFGLIIIILRLFRETKTNKLDSASQLPPPCPGEIWPRGRAKMLLTDTDAYVDTDTDRLYTMAGGLQTRGRRSRNQATFDHILLRLCASPRGIR
ncbi:hypothetical protein J3F84DRAFT_161123 [Trichoderma pleuroticola]